MKNSLLLLLIAVSVTLTTSAQNFRIWATYYGGSDQDYFNNVTTDAQGNVYAVGYTLSANNIATPGAHQTIFGGAGNRPDAYLVKFNSAGVRQWATYYGGSDIDWGYDVKVDASGNVYMTGYTNSTTGIATAGPGVHKPALTGSGAEAFLVKFNSSGVRQWGTYFGGDDEEHGHHLAIDGAGNIYMGGITFSLANVAVGGFQNVYGGGASETFLAKFDGNGTLLWSTYYGGSGNDIGWGVATDKNNNVYLCGITDSPSGIASGGFLNNIPAGNTTSVAFLVKFDSAGNRIWGTYYGGAGLEYGYACATDTFGSVYLTGNTFNSPLGISTPGSFQPSSAGNYDSYLVKFNAAGVRQWATYYGGSFYEEAWDVATDSAGNVFISGDTYSPNAGTTMTTPNAFQTVHTGMENQYLAVFNTNGVRLAATLYGNVHEEDAHVVISPNGDIYVSGWAESATGMATAGSHQNTFGGGNNDAMLVKFHTAVTPPEVVIPNPTWPPIVTTPSTTIPIKIYTTPVLYDGGTITISGVTLKDFSPASPLPTTGSSTITFTCTFMGTINGSTSIPVTCPAIGQMKATYNYTSGSTRVYDTEMLQLDLSGGTFPTGVMLRESPTLASTGLIVITDIGGGLYRMGSFFDVFTELSTDGGSSWQPGSNPPARMQLQDDVQTSIPTLSEWGLISLCVLVLSFGIFYIKTKAG